MTMFDPGLARQRFGGWSYAPPEQTRYGQYLGGLADPVSRGLIGLGSAETPDTRNAAFGGYLNSELGGLSPAAHRWLLSNRPRVDAAFWGANALDPTLKYADYLSNINALDTWRGLSPFEAGRPNYYFGNRVVGG